MAVSVGLVPVLVNATVGVSDPTIPVPVSVNSNTLPATLIDDTVIDAPVPAIAKSAAVAPGSAIASLNVTSI